jgi:nitrogen-specific signal transduction histidine kinase
MFYSTKGNQGTGLGLFITEQVIREHGGSISVKSRPGEGTLFSIRLPKSRRPTGGPSPRDLVAPQPEPRPLRPPGD